MTRSTLLLCSLFAATVLSNDHDHDHEECACIYEENDYTMDCSDADALEDAFDAWFSSSVCNVTSDCGETEGDSDEAALCQEYYYIIQGHHDYCPDDDIPDEILVGFHDMEEGGCEECETDKQYNPDVGDCPDVDCTDATDAQLQADNLVTYNCSVNCSITECISAFQLVRAYHDDCEDGDDALVDDIETCIHDFEEPCQDYECNTHNSTFEFECDEDHHDETTTTATRDSDSDAAVTLGQNMITIFSAVYLINLVLGGVF